MSFGERLDAAIAPFAPSWAAQRAQARNMIAAQEVIGKQVRQFDAAQKGRRTAGWPRSASSADSENLRGRSMLAYAAHDLVRNNKYAAAGVRQMTATIWGDGITPQFTHEDKAVAQKAQDDYDRWAESKVDGLGDWYGHGKLCVREMIVGVESLTVWKPDNDGPDGRVAGLEGAHLDMAKNFRLTNGGKIAQGVEYDKGGDRSAYHLFEDHPHDMMMALNLASKRVDAQYVDHLFERQRLGQTRGVSWLGAVAMTLRDISDIEDATRLREKVQACLALVIQPGEGQAGSPLGDQRAPDDDSAGSAIEEGLRPGLIMRTRPGETVQVVNPQPSSVTVEFIRQQLAGVSANMVPYHLMTGDVSQANYSGLRAAMNGSYTNVDDWQQNEVIPLLCRPAAIRRMKSLALRTGDRRFLQVKMSWALPVRRFVDPIKDLMGEIMEIRAGLKTITKGLGERGLNSDDHMRDIARMNGLIDELGLALDTDPRKLTDSGVLQKAAGYIAPKGAQTNGDDE